MCFRPCKGPADVRLWSPCTAVADVSQRFCQSPGTRPLVNKHESSEGHGRAVSAHPLCCQATGRCVRRHMRMHGVPVLLACTPRPCCVAQPCVLLSTAKSRQGEWGPSEQCGGTLAGRGMSIDRRCGIHSTRQNTWLLLAGDGSTVLGHVTHQGQQLPQATCHGRSTRRAASSFVTLYYYSSTALF
jgi:hypothetical protein